MSEKTFACNWLGCGKTFKANCFLERHMWVHTKTTSPGMKSICDWPDCGKRFRDKFALQRHRWVHTKDSAEARFVCDRSDCKKLLRDKPSLDRHIQGHVRLEKIRQQRHICNWPSCGMRFRAHYDLKGHLKMHAKHTVPNKVHEQFRVIPGVPKYMVSNEGRVRTVRTNRLLSPRQTTDGYMTINLHDGTRRRSLLVHRLVMLAFVGPVPQSCTVDHIDRNRSNNTASNLRYATLQQQSANRASERSRTQKRRCIPVDRISPDGAILRYGSAEEAAKHLCVGRSPSAQMIQNIRDAAKRETTYRGYTWKYNHDGTWKDIPSNVIDGQTGYSASTDGRIKTPRGYMTFGGLSSLGYHVVTIGQRAYRVHRLVAATFLKPMSAEHDIVNHINGVRHDNRFENLEYVSHSGNVQHAVDTGLTKIRKAVKQYTLAGEYLKEFPSISAAGASIDRKAGLIGACCNGTGRTAYGFVWKFSNDDAARKVNP